MPLPGPHPRTPSRRPGNYRASDRTYSPFLSFVTLSADAPKTSWAQVAKVGKFWDPRYGHFELTTADLQQMLLNFTLGVVGTDVPFDFNHGTNGASSEDQGKAAGWFKQLQLRAEGGELWALVEWTDLAVDRIASKEYRYVSPYFSYAFKPSEGPKRGQNVGVTIRSAALTNTPVLDMEPVSLSLSRAGTIEVQGAEADYYAEDVFSHDEQRRRVQAAITDRFSPYHDDVFGPCLGVYLVDLFDKRAIYRVFNGDTFEITFEIGADGAVSFTSDPVEVVATWSRLTSQELTMPNDPRNHVVKDVAGKDVTLSKETIDAIVAAAAPPPAPDVQLAQQVTDLSARVTAQDATITTLKTENKELADARTKDLVTAEVLQLTRDGKILPSERDDLIALGIKDHEMFVKVTTNRPVIVDLSGRQRGTDHDATVPAGQAQIDTAIATEMTANPALSREQAFARALAKNPKLYNVSAAQ